MPRAQPDWAWDTELVLKRAYDTLPRFLQDELLRLMPQASHDARRQMLKLCAEAVDDYQFYESMENLFPSCHKRHRAADQIAKESWMLAQKLPGMGGNDLTIIGILYEKGVLSNDNFDDQKPFFLKLRETLEQLSAAAQQAHTAIDTETNERTPRQELAGSIAFAYHFCFGEPPRASVQRDYGNAHPYVQILKTMLEFCSGRRQPITTVEHVAREGIAWNRKRNP